MIYQPSFRHRLSECSRCGNTFEPLDYGSYEKYCDECHSDVEEQEQEDIDNDDN